MNDEAWIEVVNEIAADIRKMIVICEHPDWPVCISIDGFKLHVNVNEAIDV